MKLKLKGQILAVCFFWSFVLIINGGVVYQSETQQGDAQAEILQSKQIVQSLNLLLRMMLSLESSARGYLLTLDEYYHQSFKKSDAEFVQAASEIQKVFSESSANKKRLGKLLEIKRQWLEGPVFEQTQARMKLDSDGISLEEFSRVIRTSKGKELVEEFSGQIHKALAEEEARISQLVNEQMSAKRRVLWSLVVGIPVNILLGLLLMIYIVNRTHGTIRDLIRSLSATASAMDGACRTVLSNSNELAESNADTTDSTKRTAAALDRIRGISEGNNRASKDALEITIDCLNQAIKGQDTVKSVRAGIVEISQYSDRMVQTVADNNEKLTTISELMGQIDIRSRVINDIAFQTKLLSFNASVEAASAGVHGKGFGIVAAEMGALAIKSGDAAQEIRDLLGDSAKRVQTIVDETTSSMGSLAAEMQVKITSSSELSSAGHENISELLKGVGSVHDTMNKISQACSEQDAGINEVNDAMRQISRAVEKQGSLATRYSSTAEQLQEQAEKVESEIETLSELFGSNASRKGQMEDTATDGDDGGISWTDGSPEDSLSGHAA